MESKGLLFPLMGALRACANLILTVTAEANKIRDRVIMGRDGERELDRRVSRAPHAQRLEPSSLRSSVVAQRERSAL